MNKITEKLDAVAASLESKGYTKEALELDKVADAIEAAGLIPRTSPQGAPQTGRLIPKTSPQAAPQTPSVIEKAKQIDPAGANDIMQYIKSGVKHDRWGEHYDYDKMVRDVVYIIHQNFMGVPELKQIADDYAKQEILLKQYKDNVDRIAKILFNLASINPEEDNQ